MGAGLPIGLLPLPQDSHEFLCTLLEQVQREVLAAEAAAGGGGPRVAIGATACPASRNFGFCVEHQARHSRV